MRARRYGLLAAADLGAVVLDPPLEQRRQVIAALAQRRHHDAARREQIVELARDDLRVDGALEIEIAGRDDLHRAPSSRIARRNVRWDGVDRSLTSLTSNVPPAAARNASRARAHASSPGALATSLPSKLGRTATKRPPPRGPRRCSTRATNSRPVPCSPQINTGAPPSA